MNLKSTILKFMVSSGMGNLVECVTDTDIYLGRIYDRKESRKLFYPKKRRQKLASIRFYAQSHIPDSTGHSRQSYVFNIVLSSTLTSDVGDSSCNENQFRETLLFRFPKQGQWQGATRKGKQGNQSETDACSIP
jgi:hypothetical protein